MKTRLPVDALKASDNTDAVSNQDKANVLNNYFASVFNNEDLSNVPMYFSWCIHRCAMADIQVLGEDIYHKLCNLDVNKSPGPDG